MKQLDQNIQQKIANISKRISKLLKALKHLMELKARNTLEINNCWITIKLRTIKRFAAIHRYIFSGPPAILALARKRWIQYTIKSHVTMPQAFSVLFSALMFNLRLPWEMWKMFYFALLGHTTFITESFLGAHKSPTAGNLCRSKELVLYWKSFYFKLKLKNSGGILINKHWKSCLSFVFDCALNCFP